MTITPSVTRVNPLTTIRRERLLPQAGEVVVRRGQQVSPVQIVARTSRQKGFTVIPAADVLGVPVEAVSKYLLVEEGAAIQRKKPLLRKSGLFGSHQVTSPVNGILYQVSNGRLILQQTSELIELRAVINGVVAGMIANRGIMIETPGSVIQAIWGSGREGYGNIKVVTETPEAALKNDHIDAEVRGTILVAGTLADTRVLEKAEENSVRGIIVGHIPGTLVSSLYQFRFPVLVTDGFNGQAMARPIFELLQQSEGREASLLGNMAEYRPEIVIPLPTQMPEEKARSVLQPLTEGQRVRILRAPYAGQVGKVAFVHTRAQPTTIGLRLPGVDVALSSGEVIFIPSTNLDLIT